MDNRNAAPIPARRPWYRLHLSTWLTLPLGLIVAVFIILPGGSGEYPDRPTWNSAQLSIPAILKGSQQQAFWTSPTGDNAVIHGWPFPFLWRTPQGWIGDPARAGPPIQFTLTDPAREFRYVPWKLTDSVREFRVFPLIADLALAGIGLALFAALVEWRHRKRSRALQFSLRELMIFASIMAIALGWGSHQRIVGRETKDRLGRLGGTTGAGFAPRLPLWLRTLAGDEALSSLGFNRPTRPIRLDWELSRRQDIESIVEQFPHDSVIELDSTTSSEDVNAIAAIDRLEQIECSYPTSDQLTQLLNGLQHLPHLRHMTIVVTEKSMDAAQMARIAKFPELESLSIIGETSRLTETQLMEIRNCRKLKELELPGVRLTQPALDCLGELKKLRRLNLSSAQFIKAHLEPIGRLESLEELDLRKTNLDDDDARELRVLPRLRWLDIDGTQLTTLGVRDMLDPSGGAAGQNLEQVSLDFDAIGDELIAVFKRLSRLRRITVTESSDDWRNPNGNSARVPMPQFLLDLQKTLPDCDIEPVPVFLPFRS